MVRKSKVIDGHEVYFSSDWVNDLETEVHFIWYYYQAKIVYDNCDREKKILEIGVGTGLLSDMLKKRGWDIKTIDIDEGKNPDYCSDALDFDYNDIDTVLAFEIFEHIPFETFKKVLKKLADSGVENIYFSLPWNERRLFEMNFKLPLLMDKTFSIWLSKNKITTPNHFWELAKKNKNTSDVNLISINELTEVFEVSGLNLNLNFRKGYIQYFSASLLK